MWGKAHGGLYKATTKEERQSLIREGDKVMFIDFRFQRRQVAGFSKGILRQNAPLIANFWKTDDLWDRACGLGSEIWTGHEWVDMVYLQSYK